MMCNHDSTKVPDFHLTELYHFERDIEKAVFSVCCNLQWEVSLEIQTLYQRRMDVEFNSIFHQPHLS